MQFTTSTSLRALALGTVAAVLAACSSGLDTAANRGAAPSGASKATGLGIDLGVDLTDPIDEDLAIAGALIPGVTGEADRKISFIAFTTRARTDNADGLGTGASITRDFQTPADTNGADDVFLMAIEDDLVDQGAGGQQPAAFSRALINVFRHDRCVHCHAVGTVPGPGEELVFANDPHPGGAEPILIEQCTTCHSGTNVSDLEGVVWRAPLEANGDFDFRGNTLQELADKAQSVDLEGHLLNDGRVRWAIESGNVPFVPPAAGGNAGTSELWAGLGRDAGSVPTSFAAFRAQLLAWRDGGFQTTAEESVRDVVLVSRARSGNAAGNSASSSPSITWVPNPGFDPSNPVQPAGEIVVAFRSEASNLVSGGSAQSDIYVNRVEVFIDRDPANGSSSPGSLDLVSSGSNHTLVTIRNSGGGGGNGASSAPAIDGSGDLVVFESAATNLVPGFSNQNGSLNDVYLRDLSLGTTQLVSATNPGGSRGGDGRSEEPAISPMGEAIAFTSEASDLIAGDTNAARDVFVTQRILGTLAPLERASVRTDGTEGAGGECHVPSIVVGPTGRISVAFESGKTNLAAIDAPENIFLREDGRTTLISQRRTGGIAIPGNGPSRAPRLSPTSDAVVYSTTANNLDALQPNDLNGASDVLLVNLRTFRATSSLEGRRVSLDSMSRDAEAASSGVRIGTFRDSNGSFATASFVTFRSTAEDLGVTRQDLVNLFLNDEDVVVRTDFTANTPAGPPPLEVMFSDASNGGPTAWNWSFGDGSTSNAQNPTHTYTSVGNYDVSLTVTRAGGNDTAIKTGFIRVLEPLTITGFSADNVSGPTPLQSRFTAVLGGNTEEVEYLWDFGDGTTSTEETPLHSYTTVGTFDVTLTVTGLAGGDSATELGYITTIPPSGANFSFSTQGLRATFSDLSTGGPTSWMWTFGDGGSSTQRNPMHIYDDNGTYSVTLTVNGPGGMSSTSTNVTISARSFSTIFPSFAANGCTSCHGAAAPGGNLIIDGSQSAMYSRLVDVVAQGSSCSNGVLRRVQPFDATASLLYQVVDPSVTACNSMAGMGTWSAIQVSSLVEWINEGCLD